MLDVHLFSFFTDTMPLIHSDVIIIGGGPAGSACARRLRQAGIDTLILDKASFPRNKLCAGWITPRVLDDLDLRLDDYPGQMAAFNRITFHFRGVPVPLPTRQFAIRRFEFDNFLLKRAGVPVHRHAANTIRRTGKAFIIDERFKCRYLVGAGGTHCPVYRTFFREIHPRAAARRIVTAEIEFPHPSPNDDCHLWFFNNGLPGYAWYVPKGNGCLNVGIGGKALSLEKKGATIRGHWNRLADMLEKKGLVSGIPQPKGHIYYLRQNLEHVRTDNTFIIGDAAGLATLDMGEGIGPAVQSGIAAAESIITGRPFHLEQIPRFSAPRILFGHLAGRKRHTRS